MKQDEINELYEIVQESFGILINANDFFNYASADSVTIDPQDLGWILPIYKKYKSDGLNACISHIAKHKPIQPYITEKFKEAIIEIEKLNPKVYSE